MVILTGIMTISRSGFSMEQLLLLQLPLITLMD
nr:MAG TPA: hypothetical protein [Bacteriophage sp.]